MKTRNKSSVNDIRSTKQRLLRSNLCLTNISFKDLEQFNMDIQLNEGNNYHLARLINEAQRSRRKRNVSSEQIDLTDSDKIIRNKNMSDVHSNSSSVILIPEETPYIDLTESYEECSAIVADDNCNELNVEQSIASVPINEKIQEETTPLDSTTSNCNISNSSQNISNENLPENNTFDSCVKEFEETFNRIQSNDLALDHRTDLNPEDVQMINEFVSMQDLLVVSVPDQSLSVNGPTTDTE